MVDARMTIAPSPTTGIKPSGVSTPCTTRSRCILSMRCAGKTGAEASPYPSHRRDEPATGSPSAHWAPGRASSSVLHPDPQGAEERHSLIAVARVGRPEEGTNDLSRLGLEGERVIVIVRVRVAYFLKGVFGSLREKAEAADPDSSLLPRGVSRDLGDRVIGCNLDALRRPWARGTVERKLFSLDAITVAGLDPANVSVVFAVDDDLRQGLVEILHGIEVVEKRLWRGRQKFCGVLTLRRSDLPVCGNPTREHAVDFRRWIAHFCQLRADLGCGDPWKFLPHHPDCPWCRRSRGVEKLRQPPREARIEVDDSGRLLAPGGVR